jgi:formate transporter
VPLAIMIATFDPAFVSAHDLAAPAVTLTWTGFVTRNLVPVTIGNVLGGAGLVGVVYWFVYLYPRARAAA